MQFRERASGSFPFSEELENEIAYVCLHDRAPLRTLHTSVRCLAGGTLCVSTNINAGKAALSQL